MRKGIAVFDLDGTLTYKDTLLEFMKYTHGVFKFYLYFLLISPFIALKVAGLYSNSKLKEKALTIFYKGMRYDVLQAKGNEFAKNELPALLNTDIYNRLLKHKANGDTVVILTASCNVWLREWCEKEALQLISSKLEVINGIVTGKLHGENCHGAEKKRRLENEIDLTQYDYMSAYGNEGSDKYYMDMANEQHYV